MRRKHILAGIMAAALAIGMLGGCGSSSSDAKNTESSTAAAEKDTATSGTKKLVIGDTTFNPENAEADVNPHQRLFRLGLHPLRDWRNAGTLFRCHGDRAVAGEVLGKCG